MNAPGDAALIRQHLIDPEICIRCNTCEATCPVGAVTHDDTNYVVDASKCGQCMDCIAPCPTGSIDNWRMVPVHQAYSLQDQLGWDELPAERGAGAAAAVAAAIEAATAPASPETSTPASAAAPAQAHRAKPPQAPMSAAQAGSRRPPWSAAHPYTLLYGPKAAEKFITATVSGNLRVTAVGHDYDTHHVVLDFGRQTFPVLEGQSIGILAPGVDAQGRPHHARQYSVSSPRNGERAGYNNLALTVKRVLENYAGESVRGVASNHLCDLQVGDPVRVVGPFGSSFLMPNHPRSPIVMVCTGTGSAPMRAMTEWRRRLRASQKFEGGPLLLFFGARTQQELPYFGPLQSLPKDFIHIHLALSRTPGQPKRYVQDLMREQAGELAPLLANPDTCVYVCGLKGMEDGVLQALRDVALQDGQDWPALAGALKREGRLHFETN